MKIGIYVPKKNVFADQLKFYFQFFKHEVFVRNIDLWRNETEQFDLVICKGHRHKALVDNYLTKSIPVFIFDWGYFQRVNQPSEAMIGHWQLSYAKLNGIPHFECPSDRFEKLGFQLATNKKPEKSIAQFAAGMVGTSKKTVLVASQMPGDAAVAGSDHQKWVEDKIAEYKDKGYKVLHRAHPRGGIEVEGMPSVDGNLERVLADVDFVCCYNSNIGHDALLANIPVVCDPCAPYWPLSGEELMPYECRLDYFSKAAYGQWKIDEAKMAVEFLINEWLPRLSNES